MDANEGTKPEWLRRELDSRSAIDVAVARGFSAAAGDKLAALLRLGVYEEDVRPRIAFGVQTLEEALSYLERARDHVKGALDRAQAQRLQSLKVSKAAALGFQPPAADVPRSRGCPTSWPTSTTRTALVRGCS